MGSSRKSRSGRQRSSRAMARRRCQPPESDSVRTDAIGEAGAAQGLVDARGRAPVRRGARRAMAAAIMSATVWPGGNSASCGT